jgi:hypothetical protein
MRCLLGGAMPQVQTAATPTDPNNRARQESAKQ